MSDHDVEVPLRESTLSWFSRETSAFLDSAPVVVALFGVGVYLSGAAYWIGILAAVAAVSFVPRHRKSVILAATVLFWVFSNRLGLSDFKVLRGSLLLRVIPILFSLGAAALYLRLVGASPRVRKHPVAWLLTGFFGICALMAAVFPHGTVSAALTWATLVVVSKFIWFLAYAATESERSVFNVQMLATLFPFWSSRDIPIPKGGEHLKSAVAADDAEFRQCQASGLRLLYWSVAMRVAFLVLSRFFFGTESVVTRHLHLPTLGLPNDSRDGAGPISVLADQASIWRSWAAIYMGGLLRIMIFAIDYGVIVSTCRMAGYRAFRHVYRPLAASSFAEFARRIMYFYSELIITFFFIPTYSALRRIRHPDTRRFLAVVLSVVIGGMCYHVARDSLDYFSHGFETALINVVELVPYFLAMGVVVGVSVVRRRQRRARVRNQVRPLATWQPFVFVGIYSLIAVFKAVLKHGGTLTDGVLVFKHMFGI